MKKILLAALFVGSAGFSQITITPSDIPHVAGDLFTMTPDSVWSVNVGSQGGPHHWEFSLVNPGRSETTYVVETWESPLIDSFPSVNLLYSFTFDSLDGSDTIQYRNFVHYQRTDSTLAGLGWTLLSDTTLLHTTVNHPPNKQMVFPAGFGSSWTTQYSTKTMVDSATNSYSLTTLEDNHLIDAWGTLVTPLGSFNALRQRVSTVAIAEAYVMGMLIFSDTSNYLQFDWLVNDYGPIVFVKGYSVFQDSLMIDPLCYSMMTEASVSVEEEVSSRGIPPVGCRLLRNPTTWPVEIQLQIGSSRSASIEIYDVSGRLIRRFEHVGPGIVRWDGTREDGSRSSSGIYFLKIDTPSTSERLIVSVM